MSEAENANAGGASKGSGCGCASKAAALPAETAKPGLLRRRSRSRRPRHDRARSRLRNDRRPRDQPASVRLSRRDLSFLLGRLPNQIRRRPANLSRQDQAESRRAGGHDLHLPDASADPPGRSRKLPDLRHGAGARGGQPRCAAQSRTRGHDAPLLGRPCACAAGGRSGDGRPPGRRSRLGRPDPVELDSAGVRHARSWSGPAGRSSSAAGNRC